MPIVGTFISRIQFFAHSTNHQSDSLYERTGDLCNESLVFSVRQSMLQPCHASGESTVMQMLVSIFIRGELFQPPDANDEAMDVRMFHRIASISRFPIDLILDVQQHMMTEPENADSKEQPTGDALEQDPKKDECKVVHGNLHANTSCGNSDCFSMEVVLKLLELHQKTSPYEKISLITSVCQDLAGRPPGGHNCQIFLYTKTLGKMMSEQEATSSTDYLLPKLIVNIVKANPPQLISSIR